MSILAAVFVWKLVPETKGRSLEQMEALWLAADKKSPAQCVSINEH
jgi:MFS transporter, SP family, xylose:H+ symportor